MEWQIPHRICAEISAQGILRRKTQGDWENTAAVVRMEKGEYRRGGSNTVSTMMHGEYGIEDVCLSTLTLVGPNGVQGKVPMRMNKAEIEQLQKSADALKEIIAQIDLD